MRNMRRSTKKYVVIGAICCAVLCLIIVLVYYMQVKHIKKRYETVITKLEDDINENSTYAYVAKSTIERGDLVSRENTEYTNVFTNSPTDYITEEDMGKIAIIDIQQETHILKSMLSEELVDTNLRESEYNTFYLNSNLKNNDVIDVRIIFPNGEDYIILSKKSVKNVALEESDCFLWLNEEEILLISGAIVDAYLHDGSKLYTTRYIEPNIQEASKVTYVPNEDIIKLVQNDPNILQTAIDVISSQIRKDLDKRLERFSELNDSVINWEKNSIQNKDMVEDTEDIYGQTSEESYYTMEEDKEEDNYVD